MIFEYALLPRKYQWVIISDKIFSFFTLKCLLNYFNLVGKEMFINIGENPVIRRGMQS